MKTIRYLIPVFFTLLVSSCCLPSKTFRVAFTKAQEQWFPPYKQDSIVSFIDREGKIIDFKVAERSKYWQELETSESTMCTDYARIGKEDIRLESLSNAYDDISIPIYINTYEWDPKGNYLLYWDGSCSIDINIGTVRAVRNMTIQLEIDKDGVVSPRHFPKPLETNDLIYHETIEINNHVYHEVIEIDKTVENPFGRHIHVQIFYNKDYGILQIMIDDNNYLSLFQ